MRMNLSARRAAYAQKLDEALRRVRDVLSQVEGIQRVSLFGSGARRTETGIRDPRQHVRWYTEVVPRIRSVLGAQVIFWYDLLESPDFYPGFSVIANVPDATSQPQAVPGSGLYPLLRSAQNLPSRRHA